MALISNDNAYEGRMPSIGGSTHHSHNHSDELACIRKDIGDAQSTIKDSIQSLILSNNVEFRHLDNRICENEKESIKNTLENRVKLIEVECRISKEIAERAFANDRQFAEVRKEIGHGFCELKESGLQGRLDCMREEIATLRCAANSQSNLDRILTAIAGTPVVTPLK